MITKYWSLRPYGLYVWIFCPAMERGVAGTKMRERIDICRDFKTLQQGLIESTEFKGWVACTDINNGGIMLFMAKQGAVPFEVNIKEKKIWFMKTFKRIFKNV